MPSTVYWMVTPIQSELLTLPNGERLNLPSNVCIMFEVEHLRYHCSRCCSMTWFSKDVTEPSMVYKNYLTPREIIRRDGTEGFCGQRPYPTLTCCPFPSPELVLAFRHQLNNSSTSAKGSLCQSHRPLHTDPH
ncbi:hypothetical protein V8B97DRAFT_391478 [Scleroderma yunnanense]